MNASNNVTLRFDMWTTDSGLKNMGLSRKIDKEYEGIQNNKNDCSRFYDQDNENIHHHIVT